MEELIETDVSQDSHPMDEITAYCSTVENRTLDKNELTLHLIKLMMNMSETDQRNLVKELENKLAFGTNRHLGKTNEALVEKRKHPRKSAFIVVDCATNNGPFTDFIQNISHGGVFIQTGASFYVGQRIEMNFSLSGGDHAVTVKGEVVRIDAKGIGVKFIGETDLRLDSVH